MSDHTLSNEAPRSFHNLKFHGTAGSYFKIWIVNVLFTIATLGIYSAWAKVRTTKYFNQSTEYMGNRIDYHAKPLPILIGRVIAVILFLVYANASKWNPVLSIIGILFVAAAFPILFVKSLKFKTKYTSFRNVRFSFRGTIREAYRIGLKYFGFPIGLTILVSILTMILGPVPLTNEGKVVSSTMSHPTFILSMVAVVIQLIYLFLILPKFLNSILTYIYNNVFYGGSRVFIESNVTQINREIIKPVYIAFGFNILIFAIFIFAMMFGMKFPYPFNVIILSVSSILLYAGVIYNSLVFPYSMICYVWNRLNISESQSKIELKKRSYLGVAITNFFAVAFSLGLAYPWATIRMRKLVTEAKSFNIDQLDNFVDDSSQKASALSEEISDVFDLDFEIGL